MVDKLEKESRESSGWTKILILAGVSTTIGSSLTVGFNIGVVNSPAELIKKFCNESVRERFNVQMGARQMDLLWSAIVSVYLVGGAAGSLTGSWFAGKVGRKGAIVVSTGLSVAAGFLFLITKVSNSVEVLLLARLLVGLSSGLATCVVPMYLMELAPLALRGAVGVLCPLGVTMGVLVGQVMSLSQVLGREDTWPYLLGLYLILVAFASIALPFLPESPKYVYVVKRDREAAIELLARIRNVAGEEYLKDDLLELQNEMKTTKEEDAGQSWNLGKVMADKSLLLPILLVCSMQAGQQFVGINAVFYYSVSIFKKAGLTQHEAELGNIGAGLINLVMAMISIHIMSKYNRRYVFQISAASVAVCLFLLGIAITFIDAVSWMPYLCVFSVLSFVLCYGIGLGPIPYFIGSELFEVGPRPSAMALGSMANWGANFVIGMTFPLMQSVIGAYSFFIFALVSIGLFFFIRYYLPETRGKDPTVIAQLCAGGLSRRPPTSPVDSLSTDNTLPLAETKLV